MSSTTFEGDGDKLGGHVKEAAGKATGDTSLQGEGVADQVIGSAKQAAGTVSDAISNPGPLIDKAKGFARRKPWATAALVGVIGLAVVNTLRGK